MAATAQDVKDLTGLDIDDAQINTFLAVAQSVIDQVEGCLTGKGITDTDQLQAALAAHYIALTPVGKNANLVSEEKFENWSRKIASGASTGMGYDATTYGAMAQALAAGCLASVGKRDPRIAFH